MCVSDPGTDDVLGMFVRQFCLPAGPQVVKDSRPRFEAGTPNVCDADSQGWLEVYEALFEPQGDEGELRREFDFDDLVSDVLFIHKAVFHPLIENWGGYILDHVSRLIDSNSATVMWQKTVGLSDKELAGVGFRRIAGEKLLFRPNMLQHPCDEEHALADPMSIKIDEDAGGFVRKAWGDEWD